MDLSKLNVCTCTHKRRLHDGAKNIANRRVHECKEPGCKCTAYSPIDTSLTPVQMKSILKFVAFGVIAIFVGVSTYVILSAVITNFTDNIVVASDEELKHVNILVKSAVDGVPVPLETLVFLNNTDDLTDIGEEFEGYDLRRLADIKDVDSILSSSDYGTVKVGAPAIVSLFMGIIIIYIGLFVTTDTKAREEEIML